MRSTLLAVELLALVCVLLAMSACSYSLTGINRLAERRSLKMEYIPDGLSKLQWEQMKKKEIEANKGKNLGAVGITKFKVYHD